MKKLFFFIGASLFMSAAFFAAVRVSSPAIPVGQAPARRTIGHTVILDAGHGGEDGGAVAFDGTEEKTVNLRIANDVSDFFVLFGVPFVQTRDRDTDLADHTLQTIRERKRSDILARYEMVNSAKNGLLLSIHQNMFEIEKYSGAQIFYSANDEQSLRLATILRKVIISHLQPENSREVKPSGDSIFLLYRAKRPSVLVECGFLSNRKELELLKMPGYDAAFGYYITKGMLQYFYQQGNV